MKVVYFYRNAIFSKIRCQRDFPKIFSAVNFNKFSFPYLALDEENCICKKSLQISKTHHLKSFQFKILILNLNETKSHPWPRSWGWRQHIWSRQGPSSVMLGSANNKNDIIYDIYIYKIYNMIYNMIYKYDIQYYI